MHEEASRERKGWKNKGLLLRRIHTTPASQLRKEGYTSRETIWNGEWSLGSKLLHSFGADITE